MRRSNEVEGERERRGKRRVVVEKSGGRREEEREESSGEVRREKQGEREREREREREVCEWIHNDSNQRHNLLSLLPVWLPW